MSTATVTIRTRYGIRHAAILRRRSDGMAKSDRLRRENGFILKKGFSSPLKPTLPGMTDLSNNPNGISHGAGYRTPKQTPHPVDERDITSADFMAAERRWHSSCNICGKVTKCTCAGRCSLPIPDKCKATAERIKGTTKALLITERLSGASRDNTKPEMYPEPRHILKPAELLEGSEIRPQEGREILASLGAEQLSALLRWGFPLVGKWVSLNLEQRKPRPYVVFDFTEYGQKAPQEEMTNWGWQEYIYKSSGCAWRTVGTRIGEAIAEPVELAGKSLKPSRTGRYYGETLIFGDSHCDRWLGDGFDYITAPTTGWLRGQVYTRDFEPHKFSGNTKHLPLSEVDGWLSQLPKWKAPWKLNVPLGKVPYYQKLSLGTGARGCCNYRVDREGGTDWPYDTWKCLSSTVTLPTSRRWKAHVGHYGTRLEITPAMLKETSTVRDLTVKRGTQEEAKNNRLRFIHVASPLPRTSGYSDYGVSTPENFMAQNQLAICDALVERERITRNRIHRLAELNSGVPWSGYKKEVPQIVVKADEYIKITEANGKVSSWSVQDVPPYVPTGTAAADGCSAKVRKFMNTLDVWKIEDLKNPDKPMKTVNTKTGKIDWVVRLKHGGQLTLSEDGLVRDKQHRKEGVAVETLSWTQALTHCNWASRDFTYQASEAMGWDWKVKNEKAKDWYAKAGVCQSAGGTVAPDFEVEPTKAGDAMGRSRVYLNEGLLDHFVETPEQDDSDDELPQEEMNSEPLGALTAATQQEIEDGYTIPDEEPIEQDGEELIDIAEEDAEGDAE